MVIPKSQSIVMMPFVDANTTTINNKTNVAEAVSANEAVKDEAAHTNQDRHKLSPRNPSSKDAVVGMKVTRSSDQAASTKPVEPTNKNKNITAVGGLGKNQQEDLSNATYPAHTSARNDTSTAKTQGSQRNTTKLVHNTEQDDKCKRMFEWSMMDQWDNTDASAEIDFRDEDKGDS